MIIYIIKKGKDTINSSMKWIQSKGDNLNLLALFDQLLLNIQYKFHETGEENSISEILDNEINIEIR